ncbi:hypothetical protein CYMTET_25314 [Cymbomonas tetramitiformis]|uniref:Reverse transcriptase domain-containing protein n=1 Tax=Cymbomonas tetramitiformis TaxID=36881 RepID=A0AAE0FUE4_9CHLO|nr:hypothetical protein CYMTET_25314 [Cymbomonas tetramitiformis]
MNDQEGEQSASENNAGAAGQPAAKSGMEVLLEQQGEMMKLMMKQMETLAARVEVAEEAAAKAASQDGGSAQSGDAELEALKKLPYVPHVEGNPFPARPATLETDMPQMYDLYNDKTYDALSKRTNSSMRYEQLVLAPALSYMHDAIGFSEVTLDWCQDEKDPPTVEELSERVFAAHNTFKGVFSLLSNRYTMLQLRASMESDATSHGGAEALRAKLAFIEEKVYAGSDGLVSDSVLTKWLKEFDTTKAKAVMNTHAKASAKVSTFRDRQAGKGKGAGKGEGGRGSGKGAGANSEVMQWINKGAKMRWVDKAPLPFDHGVSLGDATPPQLEWMAAETERCLKTGAWVRARRRRHVSRVFLVPKPGTNKWRLVMDFRWLNAHCVKSRCKMETLKKLRRLAKPNDWCFSFDLQDGYHVVGIDPAFQEYMQFDVRGELFQCGALPFGWNDSPRIFVKVMKVLVECLRSPRSAEDRREVRKLQSGSKVRRRWAVRRRAGGCGREEHQQGARVLPYMDDFLLLLSSRIEALRARELTSRVLVRLGLSRNEKKGQWEPTQLVEHLGLEVDLKAGQFRVTPARLQKIHLQSKALLSEASRQRRWLPARKLAAFTGLCQSVYLAVPPARLYLRELHFVLSTRRGWGAKVKLTRQAWSDIEWWLRLPAQSRWNGRKIWRSPTRAKVHTDASLFAWGGVLNLKHAARGFWSDELRHLHITHLELEAVYKTVQSFLRELTGKVVRLYCDNQAVVAMLSHFTSRNPELMRRMRRLWILLDLNDIELQARYIRSEANEWADRLSRDRDLDDWRLNRRWFQWAEREWHQHTVDRFASELSAQLPRYYAQWHDPGCEGVDSLAFSWLGEVNWVNPPWSLLDEVAHKLREEKCAATVVAPYWPGQMWFQQLEAMADEVVILPRGRDLFTPSRLGGSELLGASAGQAPQAGLASGLKVKVYWPQDDAWYTGTVGDTGSDGLTHIAYEDGDKEDLDMSKERYEVLPAAVQEVTSWDAALQERWRGELGDSSLTELAVQMQGAALGGKTVGNYRPKARAFMAFCEAEGRQWLPATGATVRLYIAHMLDKGTVQASNMQPYLSAINNYHEDMGFPGPARGRAISRAVKGMARLQVQAAEAAGEEQTVRTWLPARHVSAVHAHGLGLEPVGRAATELLRACTYVVFAFVTFGRPETGVSMRREHISITGEDISVVLHKEKGRGHVRLRRRLTIPAAGVAGLVRLLQHWQQVRDACWGHRPVTGSEVQGSYWRLPWEQGKLQSAQANGWVQLALGKLGCVPPEGGHFSGHSTRKGACTCARAVGAALEKCCFLGGWSQLSSAIHSYIDPAAVPDEHMEKYFGWTTPRWRQQQQRQPGTEQCA